MFVTYQRKSLVSGSVEILLQDEYRTIWFLLTRPSKTHFLVNERIIAPCNLKDQICSSNLENKEGSSWSYSQHVTRVQNGRILLTCYWNHSRSIRLQHFHARSSNHFDPSLRKTIVISKKLGRLQCLQIRVKQQGKHMV